MSALEALIRSTFIGIMVVLSAKVAIVVLSEHRISNVNMLKSVGANILPIEEHLL